MIGEGIDMRKLVRLNKMTKESGIKPKIHKAKMIEEELTQEDLKEVDELFDTIKAEREQVMHHLVPNDCNYFMDLSGIHVELNKTYANEDKEDYILNEKEFADAARFLDTEEDNENSIGFTNNDCETVKTEL